MQAGSQHVAFVQDPFAVAGQKGSAILEGIMKKWILVSLVGALLLGSAALAAPNNAAASFLAWMSGSWITESSGGWTEER